MNILFYPARRVAPLLGLCVCLATPAAMAQQSYIKIDGSSTVYPLTEAAAQGFEQNRPGAVKIAVGVSGTGGGFKKFCKGETDISNASRPILKKEMEACAQAGIKYIELPVAFDALTVVVHPRNNFITQLTVAELKKIWQPEAEGRILRWKDVNPAWPDLPIKLYGPGTESGTFDYFTEAIVGKAKMSRTDYTAAEDDNLLVRGVARDPGSLAYFGFAYYIENQRKLKAVPIVHSEGKPAVAPSLDSVLKGSYQPLARPIFIYVNDKALARPEVRDFVEYYMREGAKLARTIKYIPLPVSTYQTNLEHLARMKLGTVFGGEAGIGVTIEELLKRESQL